MDVDATDMLNQIPVAILNPDEVAKSVIFGIGYE